MHDTHLMNVVQGIEELGHDECSLVLLHVLVLHHVVEEVAIGYYLGYDVEVSFGFEGFVEFDDA
jgi:hypothetical protein